MRDFFGIFGRKKDVTASATGDGDSIALEASDEAESGQQTTISGSASELAQAGATALANIISKMGFQVQVHVSEREDTLHYEITGEDMGRIIGKEGNTLNALQQLIGSILGKRQGGRVFVKIDANKYRERREQTLRRMARDAAQMSIRQQKQVELEPMTAAERRIIHDELSSWKDVHTYSKGEQRERRIIVAPGPAPEGLRSGPKEQEEPKLQEQEA